jgi:hypothetical protein
VNILDAIAHPKIFKPWFRDDLSWSAWRAFLCALYGLPMSDTAPTAITPATALATSSLVERPFRTGLRYSAFVDPSGGSSDSMTMAIAHKEGEVHIIDVAKEIPAPFDPESAVAEFVRVLKAYRIRKVVGDRYAASWSSTAFERHGIRYEHSPMNRSELYLETLPALNAKRVRLLDNARLIGQLANLERRTTRGGKDSVDHSPGAGKRGHVRIIGFILREIESRQLRNGGRRATVRWPRSERCSASDKGAAHVDALGNFLPWVL